MVASFFFNFPLWIPILTNTNIFQMGGNHHPRLCEVISAKHLHNDLRIDHGTPTDGPAHST